MDISKLNSETINIKDDLCHGKALFAKLSPAYEIAAYLAPTGETETSEKPSKLHFVTWNQELIDPIARKLVHQSHIVHKQMKRIDMNDSSYTEVVVKILFMYKLIKCLTVVTLKN